MVTIPSPVQQGQQTGSVTLDAKAVPFTNVQFANPNQAAAADMSAFGQTMGALAGQIAQKRDRVNLRAAEAEWFAFEQEVNDPRSGLYTARGMDASGSTDRITEMTTAKAAEIQARYEGRFITGSSRESLETLFTGRSQELWGSAARFEMAQLDAAEQAQLNSSIETAADRASTFWNDDVEYENAISQASGAAMSMAEGKPDEALDADVQASTSTVVLARAERLLQNAPNMVGEFIQREIDAGRMDQTTADGWMAANESNIVAGQASMLVDGSEAASASPFPQSDPVQGSSVEMFLSAIIGSESSGRPDATVTIDDGRIFSGLGGVGEARFQDMKNAGKVPAGMTLLQFSTAENADLQRDALRWHIGDIDRAIDAGGYLSRGMSRDGLRAVAHLGGIGGMRSFANSGGRYNPNDSYVKPDGVRTKGTSLQNYYDKFSGSSTGGMTADQRIAAETNPAVRDAAFRQLDQRRARQHTADERLSGQVTTAIITDYEQAARDGTDFDLTAALAQTGVVEALGARIETVREYVRRQETGEDVKTSTTTVQAIEELIYSNPEDFRNRDLIAYYGDELSNSDMKSYLREQTSARIDAAKPPDEIDQWTRSATSTLVTDIATSLGVTTPLAQSRLLNQAMVATRLYSDKNGGARMSDGQLATAVRQSVTATVATFNPKGGSYGNRQTSGKDFQSTLVRANTQGAERFLAGEVDLELTYPTPDGPVNHKVTQAEFASAYRYLYALNSGAPLASEVIMALQLYPPDTVEGLN